MTGAHHPHRLLIHGSGRRGTAAWPSIGEDTGEFVSFARDSTIEEQTKTLIGMAVAPVVFAHSIGAVPAVLAAARGLKLSGLVLVEPALYDIARGNSAVERHISIVTEARERALAGDLYGFWAILRPLMFGGPIQREHWDDERATAERWSTINLPWGHGLRGDEAAGIPTLVVTGGWNDEYEAIASALTRHGARHRVLPGAGHRVQDTPRFQRVVDEFERELGDATT